MNKDALWQALYSANFPFLARTRVAATYVRAGRYTWKQLYQSALPVALLNNHQQPSFIGRIPGQRIIQICAGDNFCLMLTQSGRVYGMGNAHGGRLGLPARSWHNEPTRVTAGGLGAQKIVKIATATGDGWHSAAISDQGKLYMWYADSHSQISTHTHTHTQGPQQRGPVRPRHGRHRPRARAGGCAGH